MSLWTIFSLNKRDLSQFLLSLSSPPIPSPPSRHSSTPPANEPFTRRDFFPRLNNYKFFCPISNTFNKISLSLSLFITTTTTPSLHHSPSLCNTHNTQTLRGAQSPPVFQTGNVSVFLSLVPVWCVCVSLSLAFEDLSLVALRRKSVVAACHLSRRKCTRISSSATSGQWWTTDGRTDRQSD